MEKKVRQQLNLTVVLHPISHCVRADLILSLPQYQQQIPPFIKDSDPSSCGSH